jgi:Glycosyl hydrolases family 32 N-terminal domain
MPLPSYEKSTSVIEPPGAGPGNWAGGPSAVMGLDGAIYLSYRLRRPIGLGRGYANVIARSEDGERFETICVLEREGFECESLERPALAILPDGRWRIYVSCATPNTKHWRVDIVDADSPDNFDPQTRRTILPGTDTEALKDPVVLHADGTWHMWVCAHPLDIPGAEDRMTTRYATSEDGVDWELHGVAMAPRKGTWDERGVRVASVIMSGDQVFAYYDGRASAEDNAEEHTGLAIGSPQHLEATGDGPIPGSPYASGSLRYLSVVGVGGGYRLYFETSLRDGAHDLRTEYVPFPTSPSQSE